MQQYNIEFINNTAPTVQNCSDFETVYASILKGTQAKDIGGLCVYTLASTVVAVWDYENECAWIVPEVVDQI